MMKLIIFCVFILCNYCFAGGHVVGNGGYVVKCVKNNIETYESYDLVEGILLGDIKPEFSPIEGYINKAKDILSRIKEVNPTRYSLYMSWLKDFVKESKVTSDVDLIDIPDISIGVRPKDCSLVQAIVQSNIPDNGNSRYLINGDIWSKLDDNHKSALVIHELVYREAINELNKHENSFYVRRFNQFLFSNKIKGQKLKDYISFVKNSFFSQADAHGISIMLFNVKPRTKEIYEYPVEFWNENAVKSAHVYLNGSFQAQGVKADYVCLNRNWQIFHDDFKVSFYPNRRVKSLRLPSVDNVDLNVKIKSCSGGRVDLSDFGFSGVMVANKFDFDFDGKLTSAAADYFVQGDILSLSDEKNLKVQVLSSQPEVDLITLVPFNEIMLSKEACVNHRDWSITENGKVIKQNIASVIKNKLTKEIHFLSCPQRY